MDFVLEASLPGLAREVPCDADHRPSELRKRARQLVADIQELIYLCPWECRQPTHERGGAHRLRTSPGRSLRRLKEAFSNGGVNQARDLTVKHQVVLSFGKVFRQLSYECLDHSADVITRLSRPSLSKLCGNYARSEEVHSSACIGAIDFDQALGTGLL